MPFVFNRIYLIVSLYVNILKYFKYLYILTFLIMPDIFNKWLRGFPKN